jgi:M6 family metalloprotease-like protein
MAMTSLKHRAVLWVGAALLACLGAAQAAIPYQDQAYTFRQPNGEVLQLTIEGNDYYAEQRTRDGSLVVYDAARRGLCYARVNAAGDELESTGVLATNRRMRALSTQVREPGLGAQARARKAVQRQAQLMGDTQRMGAMAAANAAPAAVTGALKGLTVLIQFPDVPASLSQAQIGAFLNDLDYTGFGNAQSVRGYFRSVSGGLLDYTNVTTAYYTARRPKAYYTDGSVSYPARAQELMQEALNWLKSTGFNFAGLSVDANGRILGLNFLYAGNTDSAWSTGLWPHMGGMQQSFCANGVCAGKYQITNIGTQLAIGTFVHESGHLLFGWPDLYDYDGTSQGSVAAFDLMGFGAVGAQSSLRPTPPNGYFRSRVGWDTVVELNPAINRSAPSGRLSHTSGSHTLYRWSNPANPGEAFYIEAIHKSEQSLHQPDEGLAVFHVDPGGSSSNEWRPLVQMEHADGRRDPENNRNQGDGSDLYDGGSFTAFNDTAPNALTSRGTNAQWWNATHSGFSLRNISAPAKTIAFDVGGPAGADVTQGSLGDRQTLELPWFWVDGGPLTLKLSGPAAPVDFNMKLEVWTTSGTWKLVASSTGPTAQENISLNAAAGYYRVTVYSYSGAGAYTLTVTK